MALYHSSEYQTSFESIGLLVQEKQVKIHFQDDCCGGHLGFLIRMILVIFDLQVTLILPTKFRDKWPDHPGEVVQNQDFKMVPWLASWISDQKDISYFLSASCPQYFLPHFESIDLLFQEKFKKDFQDGGKGGHLGIPIWTFFSEINFDLQVTLILPTKFWASWPFCSGEEIQNPFPKGSSGVHFGFPIVMI